MLAHATVHFVGSKHTQIRSSSLWHGLSGALDSFNLCLVPSKYASDSQDPELVLFVHRAWYRLARDRVESCRDLKCFVLHESSQASNSYVNNIAPTWVEVSSHDKCHTCSRNIA